MIRGHLKHLVLATLKAGPLTGYDIMNRLGDRLGSKPSPGSIYPVLAELEKEELISVEEDGRKKAYSLTSKGSQGIEQLCALRKKLNEQMEDSIKMFAMLSGEKSGFHEHILESLKKGDLPFKELGRELRDFRDLIGSAMYHGLSPEKREAVRHIVLDANHKLEAVLRHPGPASPSEASKKKKRKAG
ncbi:MAG: PadR family transcriptional regulator [Nanoarchaeota archaeon]